MIKDVLPNLPSFCELIISKISELEQNYNQSLIDASQHGYEDGDEIAEQIVGHQIVQEVIKENGEIGDSFDLNSEQYFRHKLASKMHEIL